MEKTQLLSLSTQFLSRIDRLKKDDILLLREVVREHNRLYYHEEQPIISDTEYDRLFHALARAEADYDMLDDDSPTKYLAILASEQFRKVAHAYPMISLDNTYSALEVREWNDRLLRLLGSERADYRYYVQPKYDGLWLALIYKNGIFTQAVTRWSGVEGEDVTMGAMEIQGIPHEIADIASLARFEIRGEVMMSRQTFERVNDERKNTGEKLFANPRNAASGSLRQLDPLITRSRNLEFFAYSVPEIEQDDILIAGKSITSYHEMMDFLTLWGFARKDFDFKEMQGIDALLARIQEETENRKEYFDFDIDGMVLKLDDMSLWEQIGRTEHHPRYSIAYKFPAKQVRTRVLSIDQSVGRTGTVTPVANLEPVEVTWVIVKRATLHNYEELEKKDVRIGDYVFIMRAWEVIPEVVSVLKELRTGEEQPVFTPEFCPVCHTPLQQDPGFVAVYCPNGSCPAKIQGQLEMFVSKQGFNIDGLGEKQLGLFLEKWWITDFASIFRLREYRDAMLVLEGYKEKAVNNLLSAIESARQTTLERVFVGIGIPNVWKKTARQLSRYLWTLALEQNCSLASVIFSVNAEDLEQIRDIWPETARSFVAFMHAQRESIMQLLDQVSLQDEREVTLSEAPLWSVSLSGKSFCVTGSFPTYSREMIHALIEQYHGDVRTSVSKNLDYLIAWEKAGSKEEKARALSVRILSLDDFLRMIGEEG